MHMILDELHASSATINVASNAVSEQLRQTLDEVHCRPYVQCDATCTTLTRPGRRLAMPFGKPSFTRDEKLSKSIPLILSRRVMFHLPSVGRSHPKAAD